MMKGLFAMMAGAFLTALLIAGIVYLFFSGFLLMLFGFLAAGIIIAAVVFFIIVFIFAIVVFFALFYFMAEKKPSVTHGEYDLKMEKGKNENK